ncbi:S-adenosyl-L-methionine-dependent methyltransferase protein [Dioscorea alata]|uniref:S-adenosyl-L-methionine-dependent methyltransferase protein n=1 Tax=Dioscorea alata TaxID=55571 RepID=A0ACB7VN34_DIOAL|nr:S-adenosyl-L-methionine-dependent methyltransferase protein [Dioscorea alata]
MANAWKRERSTPLFSWRTLLVIPLVISVYFLFAFFSSSSSANPNPISIPKTFAFTSLSPIRPFNCSQCPQATPVFASVVEGVAHPFLYSLADLGTLPDKPHKNIARMLKGKPFRRPDISVTIQDYLASKGATVSDGIVVDVGANVGMATFAAAAMGFHVVAFEPVFENLQRLCDGLFLNRAWDRVSLFAAAASDRIGNITFHKLVGRLDNSAVSATGAKLAFKSNQEIAIEVPSIPLDEVIPDSVRVLLIKIDVQGWEYHVLRGASKLLSRKKGEAPYLIYEEDERLLQASNSSVDEIRSFLSKVGYRKCEKHETDAHCTKD